MKPIHFQLYVGFNLRLKIGLLPLAPHDYTSGSCTSPITKALGLAFDPSIRPFRSDVNPRAARRRELLPQLHEFNRGSIAADSPQVVDLSKVVAQVSVQKQ